MVKDFKTGKMSPNLVTLLVKQERAENGGDSLSS